MLNPAVQHRHNAKLQKLWTANALRDARYNQKRAMQERKAGNRVLAGMYSQEAVVDLRWQGRRLRIAKRERRLGR